MRLHLSFTRRRPSSLWEYAFKSEAFSKRYDFIGRVNGKTASIYERSGGLAGNVLAPEVVRSEYGKPRTECSALLYNQNFDLCFNFTFAAFLYFTFFKPRGTP